MRRSTASSQRLPGEARAQQGGAGTGCSVWPAQAGAFLVFLQHLAPEHSDLAFLLKSQEGVGNGSMGEILTLPAERSGSLHICTRVCSSDTGQSLWRRQLLASRHSCVTYFLLGFPARLRAPAVTAAPVPTGRSPDGGEGRWEAPAPPARGPLMARSSLRELQNAPDAIPESGVEPPPLDTAWVEATRTKALLKLEKLDTDLKNYKGNSIKESIRYAQGAGRWASSRELQVCPWSWGLDSQSYGPANDHLCLDPQAWTC